ncbi:hypothetical protein ABMA27_009330 [Loxostege sticticalis]|uniref:Uncharacterized protein n=1 Tax=Loxostege sticticalis TaxID=481309 RepID=A0ABR3H7L9_LOXSC
MLFQTIVYLCAKFHPYLFSNNLDRFIVPKKTRGTGKTSTAKPGATTRALFYFEGVDYDLMPENLHEKNNDCHAHYLWCIQDHTLLNTICAYNFNTGYLETYYSQCEVEVQNCRWRKRNKYSFKGDHMFQGKSINFLGLHELYYNGEGFKCMQYARMGGDPVENYFRMGARRRKLNQKEHHVIDSLPHNVLI